MYEHVLPPLIPIHLILTATQPAPAQQQPMNGLIRAPSVAFNGDHTVQHLIAGAAGLWPGRLP